ncbi:unnamed protein product [Peniophora sp. CBMAI 1063]|nr:unnamed protein product [Peniophora sp. CBMAI 1063]
MLLPVVLSLPALAVALPNLQSRQDNVHHLPLTRRTTHRIGQYVDLERIAKSRDFLQYKYGLKSSEGIQRRASEAGISVINQGGDTSYLASVSVGTPSQSLDVVLDTGSSDLWFATTACTNCPTGTPEFDTSKSSSLNTSSQTIRLSYGSGTASGNLLQDTVSLGPYTISNQIFTGVTTLSDGLIDGSLAGILGLAFQNLAVSQATPFWEALVNAGELSSPEMGFYLTRFLDDATSSTETDPGGTFTLGGTNSSLFKGDIQFNEIPSGFQPSFWLQTVSGLTVNGNSVSIGSDADNIAAIDTGTTLLGGPTAAVEAFWAQVTGARQLSGANSGFWAFPCTTNVSSTLAFGGTAWPISADDMNLGQIAQGFCMGALFDVTQGAATSSGSPSWIVGDTFLKNVYTVFRAGDSPAVGFAELAVGSSGSPTSTGATTSARVSGGAGLPTPSGSTSGASARTASGPATGFLSVALGAAIGIAALMLR